MGAGPGRLSGRPQILQALVWLASGRPSADRARPTLRLASPAASRMACQGLAAPPRRGLAWQPVPQHETLPGQATFSRSAVEGVTMRAQSTTCARFSERGQAIRSLDCTALLRIGNMQRSKRFEAAGWRPRLGVTTGAPVALEESTVEPGRIPFRSPPKDMVATTSGEVRRTITAPVHVTPVRCGGRRTPAPRPRGQSGNRGAEGLIIAPV